MAIMEGLTDHNKMCNWESDSWYVYERPYRIYLYADTNKRNKGKQHLVTSIDR